MTENREAAEDEGVIDKTKDLKSSLAKLRSLLNVDSASQMPQWCTDRIQELEAHLKEEKFIRSKQDESYDALSKYNKEMSKQIEELTKSRDAVEEKLNRAEEAVESEKKLLAEKDKAWKEEKEHMGTQKSQDRAKIETLTARNSFYRNQNGELQDDLNNAKKELDELKEQMKQKITENEDLKKEMNEKLAASEEKFNDAAEKHEIAYKQLEEKATAKNQELEGNKSKLVKAEEEKKSATGMLASFLTVIKETIGEKSDEDEDNVDSLTLESSVSKIGVALENMQTKFGDFQEETSGLKEEVEDLRGKWHESRGELMDLKDDYEMQEKRCEVLEEQLEDLGRKTKTMRTIPEDEDDEDEVQSDGNQDDMEDEAESRPSDEAQRDDEEKSDASQGEMEDEKEPNSVQKDAESDDANSNSSDDIVEVEPPDTTQESKRPLEEEDEHCPDGDDNSSDDIVEVQPPDTTQSAKRPLEEGEDEHSPDGDNNSRINGSDNEDNLAPSPKRAKVDDDDDSVQYIDI